MLGPSARASAPGITTCVLPAASQVHGFHVAAQAADGTPRGLAGGSLSPVTAVATSAVMRKTSYIWILGYSEMVPKLIFKFCVCNFFLNVWFYLFPLSINLIHRT